MTKEELVKEIIAEINAEIDDAVIKDTVEAFRWGALKNDSGVNYYGAKTDALKSLRRRLEVKYGIPTREAINSGIKQKG